MSDQVWQEIYCSKSGAARLKICFILTEDHQVRGDGPPDNYYLSCSYLVMHAYNTYIITVKYDEASLIEARLRKNLDSV